MANESEPIQGHWQAVSGVLGGEPMPNEIVAATKLRIDLDAYEVNLAGAIDSGACEFDFNRNPSRLTIRGEVGPNAGKTFLAVFRMEGKDSLQIAYDLSGKNFPGSFAPGKDKHSYVAAFTRLPPS